MSVRDRFALGWSKWLQSVRSTSSEHPDGSWRLLAMDYVE
jgi:hypothetical protein